MRGSWEESRMKAQLLRMSTIKGAAVAGESGQLVRGRGRHNHRSEQERYDWSPSNIYKA